jgi:hypothetical protein
VCNVGLKQVLPVLLLLPLLASPSYMCAKLGALLNATAAFTLQELDLQARISLKRIVSLASLLVLLLLPLPLLLPPPPSLLPLLLLVSHCRSLACKPTSALSQLQCALWA